MKNNNKINKMFLTLITIFSLASCNENNEEGEQKEIHTHNYIFHEEKSRISCEEEGMKEYYSCDGCEKLFDLNKEEVSLENLKLPKTPHNLSHISGDDPTCSTDGFKEAYKCSICNKYFEDSGAVRLIGDQSQYNTWKTSGKGRIISDGHSFSVVSGLAATCEHSGYKDAYYCSECRNFYEDENGNKLIGGATNYSKWKNEGGLIEQKDHEYDEPEFLWKADGTEATAKFVCKYCKQPITITATITTKESQEPQKFEDGYKIQNASVTLNEEKYEDNKRIIIPAIGVTASELINMIKELEHVTDYAYSPRFNDKNKLETLDFSLNYFAEHDGEITDISNYSDYLSIKNTLDNIKFDLKYETPLNTTSSDSMHFTDSYVTREAVDELDSEIGVKYNKYTIGTGKTIGQYAYLFEFQSKLLDSVNASPCFMMKTTKDVSFKFVAISTNRYDASTNPDGNEDIYSSAYTCKANEWTSITMPRAFFSSALEYSHETDRKEWQRDVKLQITNTSLQENDTVEITDFYEATSCFDNLTSLDNISPEYWNYNANDVITVTTHFPSAGPIDNGIYFANAFNPINQVPNRFGYSYYKNETGADVPMSTFAHSTTRYKGIYFDVGDSLARLVGSGRLNDLIFMVYASEETEIGAAGIFGTITPSNVKNMLEETKLYKGWNALHASKDTLKDINNGTLAYKEESPYQTLTITLKNWTKTLEVYTGCVFFEEKMDGTFSYTMNDDEFTVVNFTDIQIENESEIATSSLTYRTIKKAIDESKPDIVTFTGDQAWRTKTRQCYEKLCEVMDSFEIPYFMIFGNHDREEVSAEDLAAIVNSSSYGHFELGTTFPGDQKTTNGNVDHQGNYTIDIKNQDGDVIHSIIMMDSGNNRFCRDLTYVENPVDGVRYNTHYSDTTKLIYGHHYYDNVRNSQINWYEKEVERVKGAETTVMMHIPFMEYQFAYEQYRTAILEEDTATLELMAPIGNNIMKSTCDSSGDKTGFFDKICKLGSTKNVIAGHDHSSDYSLVYNGVRLTYSVKTGSGAMGSSQPINGYTKLVIDKDGKGQISQMYAFM